MRSKGEQGLLVPCALFGALVAGCAANVDPGDSTLEPSEPEIVVERGEKLAAFFRLDEARAGYEDEPALSREERFEALSIMKSRGIDVSRARYFDNDWVLADDTIHDARKMLREAAVEVDKSYFYRNSGTVSGYQTIYMVSDPGFAISWGWFLAVATGATDWNNQTSITFTTDPAPAGATVMHFQQGSFAEHLGPGYECYLAVATGPSGGRPGGLAINTSFNCTDPSVPAACRISFADVTWDLAVHTATHEIGHALGFAHPAQSGSTRIAGTSFALNANNPSYPSVMWGGPNGCFPGNANVTLGLSQDDVNAANLKYP